MSETNVGLAKYQVVGTDRIVTIKKRIGDNRFLCTDETNKCHPCYCMEDLIKI